MICSELVPKLFKYLFYIEPAADGCGHSASPWNDYSLLLLANSALNSQNKIREFLFCFQGTKEEEMAQSGHKANKSELIPWERTVQFKVRKWRLRNRSH